MNITTGEQLEEFVIKKTKANSFSWFREAISAIAIYIKDQLSNVATSQTIGIALSDEDTALTTGLAKGTLFMPFAGTLTEVLIGVNLAPTDATIEVDINKNTVSIFSTVISIDATEKTSLTAATPAVITTTSFIKGDLISCDIDQIGSTIPGTGLKLFLTFTV